jgi:hypothetical protein
VCARPTPLRIPGLLLARPCAGPRRRQGRSSSHALHHDPGPPDQVRHHEKAQQPRPLTGPTSWVWQDQGFMSVSDLHHEDSSGRRTTFESYAAGVDWPDVAQVERSLRVFESQLRWLVRQEWHRPISSSTARRAVGGRPSRVSMSSLSPRSHGSLALRSDALLELQRGQRVDLLLGCRVELLVHLVEPVVDLTVGRTPPTGAARAPPRGRGGSAPPVTKLRPPGRRPRSRRPRRSRPPPRRPGRGRRPGR